MTVEEIMQTLFAPCYCTKQREALVALMCIGRKQCARYVDDNGKEVNLPNIHCDICNNSGRMLNSDARELVAELKRQFAKV